MGGLFACMCVHTGMPGAYGGQSEEGTRCPGTRVTDWALNPGPLEEQQALLASYVLQPSDDALYTNLPRLLSLVRKLM